MRRTFLMEALSAETRSLNVQSLKNRLRNTCSMLALALFLAAPLYAHHLKKGESTTLPVTTTSPKARELTKRE